MRCELLGEYGIREASDEAFALRRTLDEVPSVRLCFCLQPVINTTLPATTASILVRNRGSLASASSQLNREHLSGIESMASGAKNLGIDTASFLLGGALIPAASGAPGAWPWVLPKRAESVNG